MLLVARGSGKGKRPGSNSDKGPATKYYTYKTDYCFSSSGYVLAYSI
jgi:hypothetical protein